VEAIVSKAVAADEQEDERLKHYQYQQTIITQKLDDDNKIKEVTQLELTIQPGEDHGFTIVTGQRGGVMIPTTEINKMEKQAKESEAFKANFSLRKLAPRFDKELVGKEICNGQEAYVVAFRPKEGQPYQERVEKILNNLQGKIWISTDDYSILKTDATLAHDVDLAWFFATMKKLDFYYESQPITEGRGPAKFNLSYEVAVVLSTIREKQFITMRNFQKNPS
jgi:hypothetical protein